MHSRAESSPQLKKKNVKNLAPKYQKVVGEMNLLKGNINFTNEIMDTCTCKADVRDNETLIDLLKALKEMEPQLFELI